MINDTAGSILFTSNRSLPLQQYASFEIADCAPISFACTVVPDLALCYCKPVTNLGSKQSKAVSLNTSKYVAGNVPTGNVRMQTMTKPSHFLIAV